MKIKTKKAVKRREAEERRSRLTVTQEAEGLEEGVWYAVVWMDSNANYHCRQSMIETAALLVPGTIWGRGKHPDAALDDAFLRRDVLLDWQRKIKEQRIREAKSVAQRTENRLPSAEPVRPSPIPGFSDN